MSRLQRITLFVLLTAGSGATLYAQTAPAATAPVPAARVQTAPAVAPAAAAQVQTAPAAAVALTVEGLVDRVEILRDRWGVNHIYAKNEHDLFFAQGYAAARDRLFQFELWRRQATGTVAEVFGPKELRRDIGARLHMFRGDLTAELNWYHPRGEAITNAFVDGINAYVDEALKKPEQLPVEFGLLGITPGRWTPAVVISRHNGLFASIVPELYTALSIREMGAERVKRLSRYYGGEPSLDIDPAIDLKRLTPDILELYLGFRAPIRFTADQIVPAQRRAAAAAALLASPDPLASATPAQALSSQRPEDIGSNNWVLSGARTASGKPLLANDPHRLQAVPSLRYWVHLNAPGWNVIGGGEPMLPGVSIGHNDHAAWGLTIFGSDTEDLYVYQTNPANPNQYRYRGGWEDMRVIKESIPVKGQAPAVASLKFTRAGPVLYEDTANHLAYALKAAWMEIGGAPYLASLRMDQATTWEEFREACRFSRTPAENMVWADTRGNIGYQAVAITPIRRNWSGVVPVPGDGRYEWDGYLPPLALPHAYNPEKGFWVTANNYQFPNDYPYPEAQHHIASEPFRAERITEMLGTGRLQNVADMMRLQHDELSIPARTIVPMLSELALTDPAVASARDTLRSWDSVLDKRSAAAGIYTMFQRRLLTNASDLFVPKAARELFGAVGMMKTIDLLSAPDGLFGSDPIAARDRLLATSLTEAVAELTRRFGPNQDEWQLGKFHYAQLRHPLSAIVDPAQRTQLDVGPLPRGGDNYTPAATGDSDNQASGASFRLIADLGDWDQSMATNNPGQSGDARSPHYRDLFELWARGKYFPVFFSRDRIESVTEQSETLSPATTKTAGRR